MKYKEGTWGWMLAVDFFFAGMGGAMLLLIGIVELAFGAGYTSWVMNFAAPACIGIGASLLMLELGRPFQAWRVFMKPTAILTFGAWNMTAGIILGGIYALGNIPGWWTLPTGLQKVIAVLCIIVGLIVASYPGVLLGWHKARPFWTGPGILSLFMVSSFATGTALHSFLGLIWQPQKMQVIANLHWVAFVLLSLQLLLWAAYLWLKVNGSTIREAKAAQHVISGNYARLFWGGFMVVGTAVPFLLYFFSNQAAWLMADLLVLLGGVIMRNIVVYAGEERTWLPGEEAYLAKLPNGEELFLKQLW